MMAIESGTKQEQKTKRPEPKSDKKPDSHTIKRFFTNPNESPFDAINWEPRSAKITDENGEVVFEQTNVLVPDFWSQLATTIVVSKYFRGHPGSPTRETSVAQVVTRVVNTITESGIQQGYFDNPGDAEAFRNELAHIVLHQMGTFNSPVWFNVGVIDKPQSSGCFILPVEDSLDSILELAHTEARIFKGGSGTGTNLSPLRGSKEHLSGGGIASGPVSFMRGFDAFTGVIKSGGRTRRAAKMVILDIDHPDILDFIWCKANEERKAHALIDAGYDGSIDGEAYATVAFQNSNNSVRISDAFMKAVEQDDVWETIARTTGEVMSMHSAKNVLMQIAGAAHRCGDPGVQFDTTINKYNTCKNSGRINATNACSELNFLDNTSCNLASINLLQFLSPTGVFDVSAFEHVVDIFITAQDILVDMSSYPTPGIEENSKKFRPLGIGYTNLGATLMAMGLPYDSDEGRKVAASITALMTGRAYARSARLAKLRGPFEKYDANQEPLQDVISLHIESVSRQLLHGVSSYTTPLTDIIFAADKNWKDAKILGKQFGFRNAQVSLLAPTGCLTSDAMILSSEGLLPIANLGDPSGQKWQDASFTIVQEDNTESATKFYINGCDHVYKIQTANGHEIKGTWKHCIRIIDEHGDYAWRHMKDIHVGDVVVLRLGGHEDVLGNKHLIRLIDEPSQDPRDERLNLPKYLDEHTAEILGYYMGNGYTKARGGLHLVTCGNDPDLIDHFSMWTKHIGATPTTEPRTGCTSLNINGRRLYRWMNHNNFSKPTGINGEGSAGAFIPPQILRSRSSVLTAFLRGLFEADGTVTHNKNGTPVIEFTTVSEVLARCVHVAMESLGMATSLHVQEARNDQKGKRTKYRIRLTSVSDCNVFDEKINFVSNRKKQTLKNALGLTIGCISRCHNIHHQALLDNLYKCSHGLPNSVRQDIAVRRHQGFANIDWAKQLIKKNPALQESKLAKCLELGNIQFVKVDTVEYVGEKETFDISVPINNTYVANGFLSHNTISFMLDCDTTGVEPDFSLVKTKNLVGGGSIKIHNAAVPIALKQLGYSDAESEEIVAYIRENGTVEGMPLLRAKHLPVFDCAARPQNGTRYIAPMGHVEMVGAVQPFLSGAVSKTINMPNNATPEDVFNMYTRAWKLGIKAMAIYREGSKRIQPLQTKDAKAAEPVAKATPEPVARRKRLPEDRQSITHKFSIVGHEGYVTIGQYEDGTPGEMFIRMSKAGSVISGLMDGFALSISLALQYGVPLEVLVEKYTHTRFEPSGFTANKNIPMTTSILDYIFRWMAARYLKDENPTPGIEVPIQKRLTDIGYLGKSHDEMDGPACPKCGSIMTTRTGTCYTCTACGTSGGCG